MSKSAYWARPTWIYNRDSAAFMTRACCCQIPARLISIDTGLVLIDTGLFLIDKGMGLIDARTVLIVYRDTSLV